MSNNQHLTDTYLMIGRIVSLKTLNFVKDNLFKICAWDDKELKLLFEVIEERHQQLLGNAEGY